MAILNCPRCGARLARDNRRPGALCSPCKLAVTDKENTAKEAAARERTMRAAFDAAVIYSRPDRFQSPGSYLGALTEKLDVLCRSFLMDLPKIEGTWGHDREEPPIQEPKKNGKSAEQRILRLLRTRRGLQLIDDLASGAKLRRHEAERILRALEREGRVRRVNTNKGRSLWMAAEKRVSA